MKAELIEAFKIFDIEDKGSISAKELKYCLEKMGEQISEAEIQYLLERADVDGDQRLNQDEFVRFMMVI
ncbi:MAG: EF-hand domain-containing protein [bacterium]